MRNIKLIPFFVLILFAVYSCGPSQRDKASMKLTDAKSLVSSGDTLKAIEILRSIPSLFPKASIQIGVAKNMVNDLYRQLIDNRKAQLITNGKMIAALEMNFKQERTEFDSFIQYIPKSLSMGKSWNKSFLQVNLDERGEIFLTSHYMGKDWLKHTSIKVYDEELQCKTPEVALDDPNNRESDFLDYKWEKVAYTNGKSDEVIKFIAEHADRDLKCVYIGQNFYYIILEDFNKEAIKNSWLLSNAIKRKAQLIQQVKELESNSNF